MTTMGPEGGGTFVFQGCAHRPVIARASSIARRAIRDAHDQRALFRLCILEHTM